MFEIIVLFHQILELICEILTLNNGREFYEKSESHCGNSFGLKLCGA